MGVDYGIDQSEAAARRPAFRGPRDGHNWDTLKDEAVRKQLNDVFEARGVIVFEDVEPTSKMQVEVSKVFGPLKDHPVKMVPRVDQDTMPGVIVIKNDPQKVPIVEVDGAVRTSWQPFHFDRLRLDRIY